MRSSLLAQYRQALSVYSPELLEEVLTRACRFSRAKRDNQGDPVGRIEKSLRSQSQFKRILGSLDERQQQTLAVLRHSPMVFWRWDHAVHLLASCQIDSPYQALQSLLAEGLLCMRVPNSTEPVARFAVAQGLPVESLPEIALATPLTEQAPDLPMPLEPIAGEPSVKGWSQADGWELPIRLAVLWRLAWQMPFKRTQQNKLFKRDQERIAQDPLLSSPMFAAPVAMNNPGVLAYALALGQGWLDTSADQQMPTGTLTEVWPDNLHELLLCCAGPILKITEWHETVRGTPSEPQASEAVWERGLLLLLLALLPNDLGVSVEALAGRLATGRLLRSETSGPLSPTADTRQRFDLEQWVRACLLGPLYQASLVTVGESATGETLIRLTTLGRRFMGESVNLEPAPTYPQSLLVQPNHEVVLYRQGLSVPLLAQLVQFAEPQSLGAALTFQINPDSVYHGLEAGMTPEGMVKLLDKHGGRELPAGLAASIATWANKRQRVAVYARSSLFEFGSSRISRKPSVAAYRACRSRSVFCFAPKALLV